MRDPLQNSPGYSLRRASNAMMGELAQRLAALDLRMADASVLMLIEANPKITASAMGRALDIQRANMVPLLKKLEDAKLVERAPIDGKSQGLSLTEAGEVRLAETRAVIDLFEADLIARVPSEHRAHLLPALDALWR
jgi:DNA-binding MarR family transcriptional regulator